VNDERLFRYGMGAVALTGATLGLIGAGSLVDGALRGVPTIELAGYAFGAGGGVLAAVLGRYHRQNPGETTAALAGVPASASGVAIVLATTDTGAFVRTAALAGIGLALVGSGLATYAEATA